MDALSESVWFTSLGHVMSKFQLDVFCAFQGAVKGKFLANLCDDALGKVRLLASLALLHMLLGIACHGVS